VPPPSLPPQTKAQQGHIKKISMSRLLLSFPSKLNKGFTKCGTLFAELDIDKDGGLTWAELQGACSKLGYRLSEDMLESIFLASDASGDSALSLQEFIGALCLLHILKGPEDEESVDPDILVAFVTAEEAFLSMDSAASGYISKDEVRAMLTETHTSGLKPSTDRADMLGGIATQRFMELDTDRDGRISFIDFIFTLEGWVHDAEDGDDDEQ
jgi:Ca2+-binding EF-hand superfamily protein